MKQLHYVSFNIPREDGVRIRRELAAIGCELWLKPPVNERGLFSFRNQFDSEDLRIGKVQRLAKNEGLQTFEGITHEYTDEELRGFPLLSISVDRDPIPTNPEYRTTYDLSNACPRCGTAAVQTSPLMLPRKGLPRECELTLGTRFSILVGPNLRASLLDAKVTGLELRQALFFRNNEPLPWWQIISAYEMPMMSKLSKNLTRDTRPGWGCPTCRRDMHTRTGIEPLDLIYDGAAVDPKAIPDVVHSWECWGRSVLNYDVERQLVRGFACPWVLVKPKVFDVFREFKLEDVSFDPVRIV